MDLKKYKERYGLVKDNNYLEKNRGNEQDLIAEMQAIGLNVGFLNTTGNLVRVSVTATSGVRPDKGNEKSGWYVINVVDNHIFANYGNWRTGTEFKWSSVAVNKLTPDQRQDLQAKIKQAQEEARQEKLTRYEEVAKDCEQRFQSYSEVIKHPYLESKQIKSYSLKLHNKALVVPIYNTQGDLRSLQYIQEDGQKRFVSAGEVKGNLFLIGTDFKSLEKIDSLVVVEGMATGASVYEATGLPVACVFSANFGYDAVKKLRDKTDARIYLAFDNDKTNLGRKKAEDICSRFFNCFIRIPSIEGDFNDLAQEQGLDAVKLEISNLGIGIRNFSIRQFVGDPPPKSWLVEGLLERSKPSILASIGGIGKSMLALDLAMKVSQGHGTWLDKPIKSPGNTLVLCAEDDRNEVFRRIKALDPDEKRYKTEYDTYVYTVPDAEKPLILLKDDNRGLDLTPEAHELIDEISTIKDLSLVVIDPVQSFVAAPITTSQEAAQLYCQFCSSIASKFNASVLSLHHMAKTALNMQEDIMNLRASIRGSSSLVDGMRLAIAIGLADENTVENICAEEGLDFDRTRVVNAGVVKSNSSEVDMSPMTLIGRNAVLEVFHNKDIEWDY